MALKHQVKTTFQRQLLNQILNKVILLKDKLILKNNIFLTAKASASFSFNFEEFLAKWFEACQQNKERSENEVEENNEEENNQEAEDNAKSEGIF